MHEQGRRLADDQPIRALLAQNHENSVVDAAILRLTRCIKSLFKILLQSKTRACRTWSTRWRAEATLEGTSLHTGEKVTLTLKARTRRLTASSSGRIDLPDKPFIDA